MWKMATRNEWDELQYHNKENKDRKLNDTDANDNGDNNATAHFTACVALHNWACARSLVPCTFHHTHIWLKFEPCPHFHSRPSPWSSMWLLSLRLDFLLLPLHLPPVYLPFPLLPPQRRAAAGAQQEVHGKPAQLRQQRGWGHQRRPPPPHRLWAQGPWLRRAPELISPPLLRDPCRGPGRGWPDTRRDAHWSVPRTSRLLRTRRRVSQSVVVVCKVR